MRLRLHQHALKALAVGLILNTFSLCPGVTAESHGLKARIEESPESLVAAGQQAMAHANADILRNPRRNRYEILSGTQLEGSKKPAPELQLPESGLLTSTMQARQGENLKTNTSGSITGYTVPESLAQAARSLAQAPVPRTSSSSADVFGSIFEGLVLRFREQTNDTNAMPQMLQGGSNALMAGIITPGHGYQLATTDQSQNDASIESPLERRQAQGAAENTTSTSQSFWMEVVNQNGASPFAAAEDYKVFRNVKDYGAKGDGRTDDTVAIQKAIADGGRCGSTCGDGTTMPATVYIPAGTYLVSGPLVVLANTEVVGNPMSPPSIVASSSFVGMGVLTSEAFTSGAAEWFLNSNSQLRSIRNVVVDLQWAPAEAYVVGVHWQASRGSSIENVRLHMASSEGGKSNQVGLYVENGSGGLIADLFFVGGRYGALFATQQFAANGLYFSGSETAMQMLWDWGWSLQNIVISDCGTGIDIVNVPDISTPENSNATSVNGTTSNGTWAGRSTTREESGRRQENATSSTSFHDATSGSFSLVDMGFVNTEVAIRASLSGPSTSLVVLNSVFDNVATVIHNSAPDEDRILIAGGSGSTSIDSWGYGKAYSADGSSEVAAGRRLPVAEHDRSLLIDANNPETARPRAALFQRRRPTYAGIDPVRTQILNAKDLGARGDGSSDDTGPLNRLLDMAANMSAVVYLPYGVYVVTDTLNVPLGTRIVGQAWTQIMAKGDKFEDLQNPHVSVRVGLPGDTGVVEMQGLTITASGPTAGAILMEWNVHEASQGSAGLWDTQFRVGGAKGTELQSDQCASSGTTPPAHCLGASLMLHLTKGSSAYLENIGLGAASHDVDDETQARIHVTSARGALIESQGPTWLGATSSEHNLLYQYTLSGAKDLVAGQAQTKAPYFQDAGTARQILDTSPFPGDPALGPDFDTLAVRILGSEGVDILSAGSFSLDPPVRSPQALYIAQSQNMSIYNAANSVGDSGSGTLSRRQESNETTDEDPGFSSGTFMALTAVNSAVGADNSTGYVLYTAADLNSTNATSACRQVLMATISCYNATLAWRSEPQYHGSLNDSDAQAATCDPSCSASLAVYSSRVDRICKTWTFASGAPASLAGKTIYYGWNETCAKDSTTGSYCNDVIDAFPVVASVDQMSDSDLCSPCFVGRLQMMQASPYSVYALSTYWQNALKVVNQRCSLSLPTEPQGPPQPPADDSPHFCVSGKSYTASAGDTCDSIAQANSVASAGLLNLNNNLGITNCTSVAAGMEFCLPPQCKTYVIKDGDTCEGIEFTHGIDDLARYNNWIDYGCDNLQDARPNLGSVVCVSPAGGAYEAPNGTAPGGGGGTPGSGTGTGPPGMGYATSIAAPPTGAPVAARTTYNCGAWHVGAAGDTCEALTLANGVTAGVLTAINPSLRAGDRCSSSIVAGTAYCVSPTRDWDGVVRFPYRSLGCYTNSDPNARVLFDYYARDAAGMSVGVCASQCLLSGYKLFGMQNSDE